MRSATLGHGRRRKRSGHYNNKLGGLNRFIFVLERTQTDPTHILRLQLFVNRHGGKRDDGCVVVIMVIMVMMVMMILPCAVHYKVPS